ncbi:MAG: hypothetical protein IPM89_03750 [Candidatus Competibacteraceae bacterium]|nr:MAG: hypothetical protein IPM89_03750 [Candidatus Competibacteraceae bacterium]
MEEPHLFLICLNAFVAVIGLLAALAGALRGLIELFPERPGTAAPSPRIDMRQSGTTAPPPRAAAWQPWNDTAIAVAIATATNAAAPGARVTHIEEIR